ncbi:MAG: hypothetical protein HY690_06130 [Chloroflexi bacterium]|nr:hypothetical protein [Chloroflexota bacterium]
MIKRCALLLFFFLLSTAACGRLGIGDTGQEVYIHNATDIPIVVYEAGREHPRTNFRVEPRQTRESAWPIPPRDSSGQLMGSQKVDAKDESGNLIFCRRYTLQELERQNWRIEIVEGDIRC